MKIEQNVSLKDIQTHLLDMVIDLDDFCYRHGIDYFLMGGSALGAMRHKGFIPWDDDLDVFMTVDNYDRFIKLFSKYGVGEKYALQQENTDEWPLFITQVCKRNTTFISETFINNLEQKHNLFIDVMCLYSAPSNPVKRFVQYSAAQLLRLAALKRVNPPRKAFHKHVGMAMADFIVNKKFKGILHKYILKYESTSTKYVAHYFGRARYKETFFPRIYIGSARRVEFNGVKLPVFGNVEAYLSKRYGSLWHEMPSKEVRDQFPTHGAIVDLGKCYSHYFSEKNIKNEYKKYYLRILNL